MTRFYTVRTLHRAGASRKRILEYITENTHAETTMKDIHNLVNRLKRESYAVPTIKERTRGILEDFVSKQGNLTRVYSNAEVRILTIVRFVVQNVFSCVLRCLERS
eukprot:jgi/Phyca11/130286/e_gw1.92.127.1